MLVVASLSVLTILCWAWIVPMGRDMYGPMTGASAWMMPPSWDAPHLALLFAMWTVMMAGMMLPSAAPTLLLYARVARSGDDRARTARGIYAFGAGYLVTWTLFSAAAVLLQRALTALLVLSPMMELRTRTGGAVVLFVAGVYQLTPLKRACLDACRSPAAFLVGHWRAGARGAPRMGMRHGWSCLGCCWALMLLLFAGGVMNLYTIAAITGFVLLEKLAPFGAPGGRLSGGFLIGAALWIGWRG